MHRFTPIVLLALGSAAVAAPNLNLFLNGKPSSEPVISVGGKLYVPLSAMPPLGVQVSSGAGAVRLSLAGAVPGNSAASGPGGAGSRAIVSGCQNEWLFNGIWRMRVTKVEATTNPYRGNMPGYEVTAQLSNGTGKTIAPDDTGITYNNAYNISFDSGDSFAAPTSTSSRFYDKVNAQLPSGTSTLLTFGFWPDDGRTLEQAQANLPSKFLMEVRQDKLDTSLGVKFTVKDPSFRVDLTCKK